MDSKKLLVFSDTHGNVAALKSVFNWAKERLPPKDTICATAFLGDGIADIHMAADATGFYCDWKLVGGNNDYGYTAPEFDVFDFVNHRFFICHGHRHNLYNGFNTLITAARNAGADTVLSGHSHIPYDETLNKMRLINPGSVGRPRSRIGATFAVIECEEKQPLKVEFYGVGQWGHICAVKVVH
ncbi:MAG: YfcE family phosphodiesterase [Treponema sp.]|nr:YfcE family phosphodiesterase [Treponema sp.]MCL2251586.1 YfcE family phosphodiesterase [Treponema sp.]